MALAVCLSAATGCSRAPASSVAHDAVLITLDTTRADAVAGFGGDPSVTPRLAELLDESVRYLEARTVAPVTLPSHASMLTGLTPPRHGLRDNGLAALSDAARTTAEACAEAGLRTAAFVSASVLDRVFGLDQGFDTYEQPDRPAKPGGPITARSARDTVARAIAWLEGVESSERFFLWVHLYDPHLPYEPEQAFRAQAGGRPYLGEVAAADAAAGELLDALRAHGRLERAVLVVVADHGEGLGDHGEPAHGALCYESTLRVPLLVRPPGGRAGESRAFVDVSDVHPTLLESLGLPVPDGLDGASLLAPERLRETQGRERGGSYFEAMSGYLHYGWSPLAGWVDAEGKYLHSSRPELYRLTADPEERVDLSLVEPRRCAAARARMAELLARPRLPSARFEPRADLLATLHALGYAGDDAGVSHLPSPLEPSDRPAPRDRVDELEPLLIGHELLNAGRFEESARVLAEVVRVNDRHYMALDLLGFALMNLGRFEEAAERYESMFACGPERADALQNLAVAYERTGRAERARATYLRLLALEPESEVATEGLERLRETGSAPSGAR